MTKPKKWLCVQRRLRSAWASAQSDQSLRFPHEESLGPLRRLWTDWADAQDDLNLRWAHCHFVGFVMSRLKCFLEIDRCKTDSSEVRQDRYYMSPVKRICVFEHSVMTNFNCACPAIQRGQGSGFLSEGSSWLTACMSEQRRFWRDCSDAQARLNLRCSHRR